MAKKKIKKPAAKKTKKKVVVKTAKKKVKRTPVKKKKKYVNPKTNRYKRVQGLLSSYTKENDIKLGRSFNKVASELYGRSKESPLKYVQQNIDQLYKQFGKTKVAKTDIEREFGDGFPFYHFLDEIQKPMYEGVTISIEMAPNMIDDPDYEVEGDVETVSEYYRENIHRYLRGNYNSSPPAIFVILATDKKTFVDFQIRPAEAIAEDDTDHEEEDDDEIEGEKTPKKPEGPSEIELEKEKRLTIDKQIELEKEKQKTTLASIEKANKILELLKAGLSKDEIKQLLG